MLFLGCLPWWVFPLLEKSSRIITGLICAGKIGSGIGAEIGSMRVTEQIDAMEVSGTNPFKYLVVTRILATTAMLPILVLQWFYRNFRVLFGRKSERWCFFLQYFNQVFDNIEFSDLLLQPSRLFSLVLP